MLITWLLGWIRRHPFISGGFSFLVIFLPQWVSSMWSLFSSDPLVPWLVEHDLPHLKFSPWFITIPVGISMFVTVIVIQFKVPYLSKRKLRELQERRQEALSTTDDNPRQASSLGLTLSILRFEPDSDLAALQAQLIFRNNASSQRTITTVCFIYRPPNSPSRFEVLHTQSNVGRYAVNIDPFTLSSGAERVLKCCAAVKSESLTKIGAEAGLLLTFTDRLGSLKSRELWMLNVIPATSWEGHTYETQILNGISLDGEETRASGIRKPVLTQPAITARLKVSHDIDCVVSKTFHSPEGPVNGLVHHLRAESVLQSRVLRCQAVLTRLEMNGETVTTAHNLPLRFNPSQVAGSQIKTINHKQPEYLELVWLPNSGAAEIMVDFESANLKHKPLDARARYSLFIVFTGDNIDGQEVVVDIHHEERGWDVSKRPSLAAE